jgi:hypothetical protein
MGIMAACQNGRDGLDPIGTLIAPRPTSEPVQVEATAWAAATEAAQPTTTPDYAPGQVRSKPLPAGRLVSLDNWEIQLLDVKRGEAAWDLIGAANQLNQPPTPGREYLLAQFWIKNTSQAEGDLWLDVTGSRHQLYKYYQAAVVRPQPRLETNLAAGQESLGWLAFEIAEGEGSLILRVMDRVGRDRTAVYAALEEGASVRRPAALDGIAANEWGITAVDPILLGRIATTDSWQIQVQEIILGQAAYEKIKDHNRFNDPPEPGMQYGLAYVWVSYIGPGEEPVFVSNRNFEIIDSAGHNHRPPSLVVPAPALGGNLYPGGETEGWLAVQIPETETAPILRLELTRGEARYFSLAASGR